MNAPTDPRDWETIQGTRCEPGPYPDGLPKRYGDWRDRSDGPWIVPSLTSGSDYSGCLVQLSNFQVFKEEFPEADWHSSVSGGYGTYALVVDINKAPIEALEFFSALEAYVLADDDHHTQLLLDVEVEAWHQWASRDFARALERRLGVVIDRTKGTTDEWLTLFNEAAEEAGEGWSNEEGPSVWINVDKVAAKVQPEDLAPYIESETP